MTSTHFEASYLIETPLAPEAVAEVMAGEQSCGTFTRVAGETDDLRARARAQVLQVQPLGTVERPSLPNAWLERQGYGAGAHWQRARVRIAFPIANVGANLPTLAATVSGNLYDLGEVSGLRLECVDGLGGSWHPAQHWRGPWCHGGHHHQAECGPVRPADG